MKLYDIKLDCPQKNSVRIDKTNNFTQIKSAINYEYPADKLELKNCRGNNQKLPAFKGRLIKFPKINEFLPEINKDHLDSYEGQIKRFEWLKNKLKSNDLKKMACEIHEKILKMLDPIDGEIFESLTTLHSIGKPDKAKTYVDTLLELVKIIRKRGGISAEDYVYTKESIEETNSAAQKLAEINSISDSFLKTVKNPERKIKKNWQE